MLNKIELQGRIVRTPEMRRTGNGIAVTSFTVACDRDFSGKNGGEKEVDFIDCVAWRQTGEFISKYFDKGRMIVLVGRLQIRNWNDKDGNKRKSAEVVVDNAYFGDTKRDSDSGSNNNSGYSNNNNSYGGNGNGYNSNGPDYSGYSGGYDNSYGGGTYSPPPQYGNNDYAYIEDDDPNLPY